MKTERTNWNTELFKERMAVVNPNIEIIGEYKNISTKIHCMCKICMTEWNPMPNNILRGSGCPQCAKAKSGKGRKLSEEVFKKRVYEVNPQIEILGNYQNTKSKIECRCLNCGNVWSPSAQSLLISLHCPKCAYVIRKEKNTMTQEEFESKLHKINPFIKIDGTYNGIYTKVDCHCLVCGYKWKAVPHNLLTRGGCRNCCRASTSYVEQMILRAFALACGEENVMSRDRTAIGKELDIYIPHLHFAVEPGTWTFHKNKTKKDKEKIELCHLNGIELIVIYYTYTDDKEYDDSPNIMFFRENLAIDAEFCKLKDLIYILFSRVNIDKRFTLDEWESIKNYAYLKSRRLTTDEFKQKLFEINPNIEFLGQYTSSQHNSDCICKICGHKWKTNPNRLLQGQGCPNCWNLRRGQYLICSHEDFVKKIHKINPNIKVVESYTKSNVKIRCCCNKCGYEWKATPANLLQGKGCPKCAGNLKLTTEEFISRMKKINSNIEIIGEYANTDSAIECLCKVCNHTWIARPHYLLKGRGCPKCANKKKGSSQRMTQEQFESKLSIVNPHITIIGKYLNNHTKIECECNLCGNRWSTVPRILLNGHGCPICAKSKRKKSDVKN